VVPVVDEEHLQVIIIYQQISSNFTLNEIDLLIVEICTSHQRIIYRMDDQRLKDIDFNFSRKRRSYRKGKSSPQKDHQYIGLLSGCDTSRYRTAST
jgi:hypothetical protein